MFTLVNYLLVSASGFLLLSTLPFSVTYTHAGLNAEDVLQAAFCHLMRCVVHVLHKGSQIHANYSHIFTTEFHFTPDTVSTEEVRNV